MEFVVLVSCSWYAANISGLSLGLATGVGGIVGTLLAGIVAQGLARRDERWFMIVPAITSLLGTPFTVLFLFVPAKATVPIFFGIVFFAPAMIGPVMTVIQAVAKVRMRAFAAALIGLIIAFLGVGLGPLAVGVLSDLLTPKFGVLSLRYALTLSAAALAAAAIVFAIGARHLKAELARAMTAS